MTTAGSGSPGIQASSGERDAPPDDDEGRGARSGSRDLTGAATLPPPEFLLDDAPAFVVMRVSRGPNQGFRIDFISESCKAIWGLAQEDIGDDLTRLWRRIHPDDVTRVYDAMRQAGLRQTEWASAFRIPREDGTELWVVARGLPRRDSRSSETWSITVTDVTGQMRAFHELQASEARFRALAENVPGAIFRYCVHPDGRDEITDMSPGCFAIWELSPGAIIDDPGPLWAMVLEEDLPDMQASIRRSIETLEPWTHAWRIRTPSGAVKWLQGRGQPTRIVGGATIWHSLIFDVTEQRLRDDELRRLALQDDLTGLANRTVLNRSLADALADRLADGAAGALLLLDLDHFKEVNGALGHEGGDRFLKVIADRLRMGAPERAVVARIGGDEFALLLPLVADGCREVVETAQRIGQRIAEDVEIEKRSFQCTASIGVALFPADGATSSAVLRHADMALAEAKTTGGACCITFERELSDRRSRRNTLGEALRNAISHGDIEPAFQPIVDAGTGIHRGFEVLARWTLDGQPVPPAEFVPLAEERGLGLALGEVVMAKAFALARGLADAGLQPGPLSINVGASQMRHDGFVQCVAEALRRNGFPPQALEIEVTESVILGRWAEEIATRLDALHELGARIAMDDFGTGYASLAHLRRLHVDRLKIDRSFVSGIGTDPGDEVIVRAIVNLAHSLCLDVVAEGIETDEQLDFLRRCGCDLAQGYLIARPSTDRPGIEAYLRAAPRG